MTIRRPIVAALVPLIALVGVLGTAPDRALAGGSVADFRFYGSGYGHGLGLSQYGAYGLAERGWNYREILTHYYSRTTVEKGRDTPNTLRVGLAQGRSNLHLEARGGPVVLRSGHARTGRMVGKIPKGERWSVRPAGERYKVFNARGNVVGHRAWGGTDTHLYATFADRVYVPESGNSYQRGSLELNLHGCSGSCSLRLILVVPLEQYLYGVAEVPNSWPADALRAQAVAARSYAIAKVDRYGQHAGVCNCGLTADWDQAYAGYDKERGDLGDRWGDAVRETGDEIVTFQGRAIQAFYSSSSGGFTEDNENVWGGSPIPYLRGVCDPGDYTGANPNRTWRVSMTAAEVTDALRSSTGDIGMVHRFSGVRRGVSGRIVTVRVDGSSGDHAISGSQLRAELGLRDDRVWINEDLNIEGSIRELYDRLDCAPGQAVSAERDVTGGSHQVFESGRIVRNAHPHVTVWVRGAIDAEYAANGGPGGELGLPLDELRAIRGLAGCEGADACERLDLERGTIYLKASVGAHALRGKLLAAYLDRGGPAGSLGFPTTTQQTAADGSATATFEHGSIFCDGAGVCGSG